MAEMKRLTAEQFAMRKHDLPDGGRWVELVAGSVVSLEPPNEIHGNFVLNFSKALAEHLQGAEEAGYACFDLGLVVSRNPDTVRVPQVSYFPSGERFEATDAVVTETPPAVVVEVASTNDRRRSVAARVGEYLHWGVKRVWVADALEQRCLIFRPGQPAEQLTAQKSLSGDPFLPGFRVRIADLFAEPPWWRG